MAQQNGDMFGADFFPTPRSVARKMVAKIKDAKYWLEPSGGKGDLADVIRNPMTWEEFEAEHPDRPTVNARTGRAIEYDGYDWDSRSRRDINIDVIESHPGLIAVLRDKAYPVVGYDFLDYNGVSYYDAIVMNPPFSAGAKHLLKAWDFLHNGQIVCLLNQETVDNPYTEDRKRLAKIIEMAGGEVERLGPCFDTAERKTSVNVAMVYLKKVAPDDTAEMWTKDGGHEKVYDVNVGDDPNMLAIRDNLGNMEHWFNMANQHFMKGIEHIRRAKLYMDQNKIHDYQKSGSHEQDFEKIVGMALGNVHTSRAEFLRRHRLLAWTSVFNQMHFEKWLDSKQQEKFMRDVERDATIPFTAENIKGTLENIFLSRGKLFDESVANVFDELTSHDAGNTNVKSEGWKTNDSYKVNERLVFPNGCRWESGISSGYFTHVYGGRSGVIYKDLDRILCVLDAKPFEGCPTIDAALHIGFEYYKKFGDITKVKSDYFEIRFFKKGTVHLKWLRLDLLESFNKTAARGKKWIGENTQQCRPTPKRDSGLWCKTHGHEFEEGKCRRCEVPEVIPFADVTCDLCRAIARATGEVYCPVHPKPGAAEIEEPEVEPVAEVLQICGPEMTAPDLSNSIQEALF